LVVKVLEDLRPKDRDFEPFQGQEVAIPRDNYLSASCQGALQNPVVGRVFFDDFDFEAWAYELSREQQLMAMVETGAEDLMRSAAPA